MGRLSPVAPGRLRMATGHPKTTSSSPEPFLLRFTLGRPRTYQSVLVRSEVQDLDIFGWLKEERFW